MTAWSYCAMAPLNDGSGAEAMRCSQLSKKIFLLIEKYMFTYTIISFHGGTIIKRGRRLCFQISKRIMTKRLLPWLLLINPLGWIYRSTRRSLHGTLSVDHSKHKESKSNINFWNLKDRIRSYNDVQYWSTSTTTLYFQNKNGNNRILQRSKA